MLGRMWPEPAGELGALELGELLCDEVPPRTKSGKLTYEDNIQGQHSFFFSISDFIISH